MKKNLVLDGAEPLVLGRFGKAQGASMMAEARARFDALCTENQNEPKALVHHTHDNIYPTIALFETLVKAGMARQEAADFLYVFYAEWSGKMGKKIQTLLRCPYLYRLMPALWKALVPKMYSEQAGFRFRFYDVGKRRVKFDMLACPYYETCVRCGCPEIVPAFCRSDVGCYGDMHPRLRWNRTKTIGGGADVCEFDLIVEDAEETQGGYKRC